MTDVTCQDRDLRRDQSKVNAEVVQIEKSQAARFRPLIVTVLKCLQLVGEQKHCVLEDLFQL